MFKNLKLICALSLVLVWGGFLVWAQSSAPMLQYGVLPFSTANTATGTATLSIGQIATGLLVGTPVTTATYTTPAASAFCAAFPFVKTNSQKRWSYDFYVKNMTTGVGATLAGGSGVTISGSGLVGGLGVKRFRVILDDCGTPAVHILPIGSAGW